jgi:hypothetical protein
VLTTSTFRLTKPSYSTRASSGASGTYGYGSPVRPFVLLPTCRVKWLLFEPVVGNALWNLLIVRVRGRLGWLVLGLIFGHGMSTVFFIPSWAWPGTVQRYV